MPLQGEADPDWDPTVEAIYNREVIFCSHCGEQGVDRNLVGHEHLPHRFNGNPPAGVTPQYFQVMRDHIPPVPYRFDATESNSEVLYGEQVPGNPGQGSGQVLQGPRQGVQVPDGVGDRGEEPQRSSPVGSEEEP